MNKRKYCVIMAGGIGSRFWPISRNSKPKQFLDILGTGKSFLRATYERFLPVVSVENFFVVTNAAYKDLVLEQIPELSEHQVLCEPIGRNTAPCIAYAAFRLRAVDPDAQMIVTPSDHLVLNESVFTGIIEEGLKFADQNPALVTIGIKPTNPNTGYGYIQIEKGSECEGQICKVKTFTEKPNLELAKAFVESGEFFWNSGIFIWNVRTILSAIEESLPELYGQFEAVNEVFNTPAENDAIRTVYSECRGISIDFGVMEKARNVYVICSDFGWSDIGTWGSLYEYSDKDSNGNAAPADALLYDTEGCIVKMPEGRMVVIEGLKDYIVVENRNVLMICPKQNEQNIKKYIEEVKFRDGDKFI